MPRISIENFDANVPNSLDSPRTMEAALRLGIDLDDLYVRPLSYFVSRARDHKLNLAKVLLEHYEGRRTAAVAEVVGERKRVIAEGAKLLAATGGGAAAEGVDPVALAKEALLAKGREKMEAERLKMEEQKKKIQADMEANMANQKLLAEQAAKDAVKAAEAAEAAAQAKKEAKRKAKAEEKKRAAKVLEEIEAEIERAKEARRLAAEEFEKEKAEREMAAAEAKKLLLKRREEEEAARQEKMDKEAARLEAEMEKAEEQRVRVGAPAQAHCTPLSPPPPHPASPEKGPTTSNTPCPSPPHTHTLPNRCRSASKTWRTAMLPARQSARLPRRSTLQRWPLYLQPLRRAWKRRAR